jgi:hypothetical protein
MKVGDMIRMIAWRRDDHQEVGLVVNIGKRHNGRRVATVFTNAGSMETWPLDSHYDIEVISESS